MAITLTAGTSVESTGSVTSTTVTLPSGLTAGDYTIIVVSLNATSGVITTPSGWTNILASTNSVNGSTSDALAIFYRRWVPGDTDPAITTTSGRVAATPIRVQGADATAFVDVAASVTQAASGATTITSPSITPAGTTLVSVFNGRNASATGVFLTPFTNLSATMTKVAEASGKSTTATNAGHCIGVETVTAGAATGTRQADPAAATTGAMGVAFSLQAAVAKTRTNLVVNPSFEVDTTGWTPSTMTRQATQAFKGTYSARSLALAQSVKQPATAGLPYTASGYFEVAAATTMSFGVTVNFFDVNGTELSPPTFTYFTNDGSAAGGGIKQARAYSTRTAPAGTTQVALTYSTNGSTYIASSYDGFLLEQSAVVGSYFDGTTAGAVWNGTAHASTSTLTISTVNIKTHDGSAFVTKAAVPKYWDAREQAWVEKKLKRWNGSAWVALT